MNLQTADDLALGWPMTKIERMRQFADWKNEAKTGAISTISRVDLVHDLVYYLYMEIAYVYDC